MERTVVPPRPATEVDDGAATATSVDRSVADNGGTTVVNDGTAAVENGDATVDDGV